MSAPSGSVDLSTAVVTAGAVGLGTAVTLLIGFARSSQSPPIDPGGAGGFVVSVALALGAFVFTGTRATEYWR